MSVGAINAYTTTGTDIHYRRLCMDSDKYSFINIQDFNGKLERHS